MKKNVIFILVALLLFTTACSGGDGASNTALTTTTFTSTATATTTPDSTFSPTVQIANLIPDGYPTDDAYHVQTDNAYMSDKTTLYCEEANRYYFQADNFLMSVSAETMEAEPLCKKEGCLHQKEIDAAKRISCDAVFNFDGVIENLHYDNGRIYIAHTPLNSWDYILTSMNTDGTDLRTELQLQNAAKSGDPNITKVGCIGSSFIHRGRLYYTWARPTEQNLYCVEVWTYALNEENAEPQCIFKSSNAKKSIFGDSLCALGTKLFLCELYDPYMGKLHVLDLLTGEWSEMEVPSGYRVRAISSKNGALWAACQTEEFLEQYAAGTLKEYPDPLYTVFELPTDGTEPVKQPDELSNSVITLGDWYFVQQGDSFEPEEKKFILYDAEAQAVAELHFADYFEDSFEFEGELEKNLKVTQVFWELHPQTNGKLLVEVNERYESTKTGASPGNGYKWYYADITETNDGAPELKEFFRYSTGEYDYKYISARWKSEAEMEE